MMLSSILKMGVSGLQILPMETRVGGDPSLIFLLWYTLSNPAPEKFDVWQMVSSDQMA